LLSLLIKESIKSNYRTTKWRIFWPNKT